MASLDTTTHPQQSANVFASAGSGKTWLLITRICRLLLSGAEPQHILAITFTRKSAAEMRARLFSRLEMWSVMDEKELADELRSIGEASNKNTIKNARNLFEKLTFSDQAIRISTFHAFCEEIIRAFPLESELPTTFELTEHSHIYENLAWKRLLLACESQGKHKLREHLHTLFDFCFGLNGCRAALTAFLYSRSEWRVYTQHAKDAAEFAYRELIRQVGEANVNELEEWFESDAFISKLKEIHQLLRTSPTPTYLNWAKKIEPILSAKNPTLDVIFQSIKPAFLTNDDKPRNLTIGKAWQKNINQQQAEFIIQTHQQISGQILSLLDQQIHAALLKANKAWFYVGEEFLKLYQQVKFEHSVIDFNDLEWETFRLLQQEDHALWVQYKLGQRIRHFLVDEFQDTSPIQWHLLKPLIESSHDQHQPQVSSLFLVGDIKQSIYGFRGANPKIQTLASEWSQQQLNSQQLENDHSWRSSPAIIKFVNTIFKHSSIAEQFCTFQDHDCEHAERWGYVKIHPLIEIEKTVDQLEFRNPLEASRKDNEHTAHYREGRLIAEEISQLIKNRTPIYDDKDIRAAEFNDILILTRTRSHLDDLKAGLVSLGIPVQANDATRLLDYLEIKDMLALLTVLVDPYDDLAFTHLLSSPVFNLDEQSLITLNRVDADTWIKKLDILAASESLNPHLDIVKTALQNWHQRVDRIPVHDLLNYIFSSWNIINRYRAVMSEVESQHICARLNQFLQQSLDIESGRYSSVSRFLRKIKEINPEALFVSNNEKTNAVEIMTVHGSKGLESAIVFIADSGPGTEPPEQFSTIMDWPAAANAPEIFMLGCKKSSMSNVIQATKESFTPSINEELNLLYVALTRAKQILIMTGVQARRSSHAGWHQQCCTTLELEKDCQVIWSNEHMTPPELNTVSADRTSDQTTSSNIAALLKPMQPLPSTAADVEPLSAEAMEGTIIHKLIEIMSQTPGMSQQALLNRVNLDISRTLTLDQLKPLIKQVDNCLSSESLKSVFEKTDQRRVFHEVSLASTNESQPINIIDLMRVDDDCVWIIDFKTQADINHENTQQEAIKFRPQLTRYALAAQQLYPAHKIRCSIFYTRIAQLVDVKIDTPTNLQ